MDAAALVAAFDMESKSATFISHGYYVINAQRVCVAAHNAGWTIILDTLLHTQQPRYNFAALNLSYTQ